MNAAHDDLRSELPLRGSEADVDAFREEVERCAEAWNLPMAAVVEVQIALDEVVSNIITHGYGGREDREIELHLCVEGDELVIDILDGAPPFSIFDVPPPNLSEELDERELGGLGIHLVRSLMDDVQYRRDGERNHVTLRKQLEAEE